MAKVAVTFEDSSSYMTRVCAVMNVAIPERGNLRCFNVQTAKSAKLPVV
jgi:hypothetical protein